jgi:hypothetical protein
MTTPTDALPPLPTRGYANIDGWCDDAMRDYARAALAAQAEKLAALRADLQAEVILSNKMLTELEALRAERDALKRNLEGGALCYGKMAGEPPHYVPACVSLRAESDALVSAGNYMLQWVNGGGNLRTAVIQLRTAIDSARTGGKA